MRAEVFVEAVERRRSILWWALGLAALVALNVAFYPSIRDDEALTITQRTCPSPCERCSPRRARHHEPGRVSQQPDLRAVGADPLPDLRDRRRLGGRRGRGGRGTLDLILAQPLRRQDYVIQRFLALAALVAALALVLLLTVALGSWAVDLEIGFGKLLAASSSVGLLALLFGSVALAAGAIEAGRAPAIAAAAGLAVVAWLLDGLARAVDLLDSLRPLSPYYQAIGRNPLREEPRGTDGASSSPSARCSPLQPSSASSAATCASSALRAGISARSAAFVRVRRATPDSPSLRHRARHGEEPPAGRRRSGRRSRLKARRAGSPRRAPRRLPAPSRA